MPWRTTPGVCMSTPQPSVVQQNGMFLYDNSVLTPSASSVRPRTNWPRLSRGPNFSPKPYTAVSDFNANATHQRSLLTLRPNAGTRERPRKCWSVIDSTSVTSPRRSVSRNGECVISSVTSLSANTKVQPEAVSCNVSFDCATGNASSA